MEYYSPLEAALKPTEAADAKQLFGCLNGQFLELYKWDFFMLLYLWTSVWVIYIK